MFELDPSGTVTLTISTVSCTNCICSKGNGGAICVAALKKGGGARAEGVVERSVKGKEKRAMVYCCLSTWLRRAGSYVAVACVSDSHSVLFNTNPLPQRRVFVS